MRVPAVGPASALDCRRWPVLAHVKFDGGWPTHAGGRPTQARRRLPGRFRAHGHGPWDAVGSQHLHGGGAVRCVMPIRHADEFSGCAGGVEGRHAGCGVPGCGGRAKVRRGLARCLRSGGGGWRCGRWLRRTLLCWGCPEVGCPDILCPIVRSPDVRARWTCGCQRHSEDRSLVSSGIARLSAATATWLQGAKTMMPGGKIPPGIICMEFFSGRVRPCGPGGPCRGRCPWGWAVCCPWT